jgi:hypothetical protein
MCSGNEELCRLIRFLWAKYVSPIDNDNHVDDDFGGGVSIVVVVIVVTGRLNTWRNSNPARMEELTLEYRRITIACYRFYSNEAVEIALRDSTATELFAKAESRLTVVGRIR